MSDRSNLDLAQKFERGNKDLTYWFTEASTLERVRYDILNAFLEGCTCFRFRFRFKGRLFGRPDSPEDNVAIPHAAGFDERDALEMAETAHARFLNTVSKLIK